jgi:hypothetical protein
VEEVNDRFAEVELQMRSDLSGLWAKACATLANSAVKRASRGKDWLKIMRTTLIPEPVESLWNR